MKRFLAALVTSAFLLPACVKKPGSEPREVPNATEDAPPNVPFGSHTQPYVEGSILPSAPTSELDRATRSFYDYWKKKYVRPGCGDGELVVESKTKPTNLTVSEAHGYGMIITAYMAGHDPEAKRQFDAMLRYHRNHQSAITSGIMAWYQDRSCRDAGGDNGATDGDLDIAYGMLLADRQWGSCGTVDYGKHAEWVIAAISRRGLEGRGRYVLLGDWVQPDNEKHYNGTRPSDFMASHFRSFGARMKEPVWNGLVDNVYWIAERVQQAHAPETGLLPDFVQGALSDQPRPASNGFLEGARDGSYAYNACRIPLRFGTDFLVSGDPRARRITQRINEFARKASGGDPRQLRGGYHLDGREMVDYETMAFTGPFGVGAMVDPANQEWLDALWQHTLTREPENYYEDTLRMLSMIVMSGNWWVPERAPDPCAGRTE
jgi:endo-1,4-beta-D-glucanase Y